MLQARQFITLSCLKFILLKSQRDLLLQARHFIPFFCRNCVILSSSEICCCKHGIPVTSLPSRVHSFKVSRGGALSGITLYISQIHSNRVMPRDFFLCLGYRTAMSAANNLTLSSYFDLSNKGCINCTTIPCTISHIGESFGNANSARRRRASKIFR